LRGVYASKKTFFELHNSKQFISTSLSHALIYGADGSTQIKCWIEFFCGERGRWMYL